MTTRRLEESFERFRRDGDARALAEVFDETAPELLRLARHLARRGDAEDLVQATFLLAIEKRASFDASRPLRPWLIGILVRQAAFARRTLAREVDPARLDERANPDPHALAEARELAEAVGAALAQLSAADREVLIPLLLDGRRAVEIARELGRRPEAIHMRVHRGLARLRRLLPAGVALALSRVALPAELARVRAAVLHHAHCELGLAASAVVPFSVLGVAMSIGKFGLAAAALVLALVAVRFVSRFLDGVGGDEVAPLVAVAPSEAGELRGADIDVEATHGGVSPADERVPSPPAAPNELEIEVVRADGEPAAEADVVLVRAEVPLVKTGLDEHGRATFAAGAGEGDLFVRSRSAFPHRARVALAAGRVRVELPRGEELSGRLLEQDGSPVAGLEVSITTDFDIPGLADAPLRELGLANADSMQLVAYAVTGADGSFHFRGLPEGWSGELELLGGCLFVEGGAPTASNRRWFPASGTGFDLTSTHWPRLTGRLIEAGTRHPLAHHWVHARIGQRSGDVTSYVERTDGSGRFEIALAGSSPAVSFQLVFARDQSGRSSVPAVEIRWEGVSDPRDLGEIEVAFEPARPLEFAVRDAAGKPIPLAQVALDSGQDAVCDSIGIARFSAVPLSTTRASAAAPGRAVASVQVDAKSESTIEIVLRPTNELTIALPDDVEARTFKLQVRSSSPLFGEADWTYPQRVRGAMVGYYHGASEDSQEKPRWTSFSFADDGRIVLEGIEEHVPFRLEVAAEFARVVFDLDCEPMSSEERRLVRVELRSDPLDDARTVRGRVVDGRGRGVIGAQIGHYRLRTGFDGSFSLATATDGPSQLVVRKRGFTPAVLDLASEPGSEVVVVLARGRDLEVRVVDASGRVCEDALVWAQFEGVDEVVAERDAGGRRHFLLDLPALPVLVSAGLGARTYSVRVEPTDRSATIEVPEHGRVEVAWSLPPHVPPGGHLRVFLQSPGDAGNPTQVGEPSRSQVEYVLRHVLPGEYELVLARCGEAGDPPSEWVAVLAPVRIWVEPGATQRVELR